MKLSIIISHKPKQNKLIWCLQLKSSTPLWCVKVRSHGAAIAAATVPLSIGFHCIKWTCSHWCGCSNGATSKWVLTPLCVAVAAATYILILLFATHQWNPIDSGTVVAAIAAPCERTFIQKSNNHPLISLRFLFLFLSDFAVCIFHFLGLRLTFQLWWRKIYLFHWC